MRRSALLLFSLLALAACRSESRLVADDLGISIQGLDGWSESRDRGAFVLSADGRPATIAIRAATVQLEPDMPDLSRADMIVQGTREVLKSLPEAQVQGPTQVEHPEYPAYAYDLSFAPAGRDGRYQRRHVVLIGDEKHVFHLMHTAPEGQLSETSDDFDAVVSSLRQEIQR